MTNSNKKKKKTNDELPDNPERVSGGPTTRQTMCSHKSKHDCESEQTEVTASDQHGKDNHESEEDLTTDPIEESPTPKMGIKERQKP